MVPFEEVAQHRQRDKSHLAVWLLVCLLGQPCPVTQIPHDKGLTYAREIVLATSKEPAGRTLFRRAGVQAQASQPPAVPVLVPPSPPPQPPRCTDVGCPTTQPSGGSWRHPSVGLGELLGRG